MDKSKAIEIEPGLWINPEMCDVEWTRVMTRDKDGQEVEKLILEIVCKKKIQH